MDNLVDRRGFLSATATAAAGAACAPAATPAAPAAGAPGGSTQAAWEQEWDQLVAEAKKEGKLNILTLVGPGYRRALDEFEQAFGISVDQQSAPSATVWLPKLQKEREAALYELDVAIVPPNSALNNIRNAWDPLRPAVFRPDVTNDKAWRDGFNARFMDKEKQLCFNWEYAVQHVLGINTDLVKEGEIKTAKDLLDPRWKGKMIMADPRFGDGYLTQAAVRKHHGEETVRQLLLEQDPAFSRDPRQIVEGIIRGRYPWAVGVRTVVVKEFKEQGLTRNLKVLDMPDMDFVPATSLFLANKSPHPNAAKLFINWFLSKEGQTVFAKQLPTNSARADVEIFSQEDAAVPGRQYYETGKEENYEWIVATQKFINELTGLKNVGN